MAKRKKGIPGLSFSWKRALGVTKMKRTIARKTGIPTTRGGRQRKAGKMMGCMTFLVLIAALLAIMLVLL